MLANKGQTWAIFCSLGYDVRTLNLTSEQAKIILDNKDENLLLEIAKSCGIELIQKRKPSKPKAERDAEFNDLLLKAFQAGMLAGNAIIPTPMIVEQHSNLLDDTSPVIKRWHVADGVCGFAWVEIKPATQSFARWYSKKTNRTNIWCHEFGQSMAKKIAWADAVAEVLGQAGIKCYSRSRID